MNAKRLLSWVSGALCLCAGFAEAQAPLQKPLADFDKLVSQLKVTTVVGEPIRVGETIVIPFVRVSFGMGAGGAMMGFGGGMGGKTVPLGVLIVEGDDVRAELFPDPAETPSLLQELLQLIRDRKIVIMGNGLNLGGASPSDLQSMAPLVSAMMGQTTWVGNAINLGNVSAPSAAASPAKNVSLEEMKKLFDAKKYADALAVADALIAKDPQSAVLHVWKGQIMGAMALGSPLDTVKYGTGAMQEYEQALAIDPNNAEAHLGRAIGRLAAPPGFGGDIDGAIADLDSVIAKKPSAEAYYYLGEAYRRKGLEDKARIAYGQALKLRPDFAEAKQALSELK